MDIKDIDNIWNNVSIYYDLDGFPEIIDKMERLCVILRNEGCTYTQIQRFLGNPSKKWIRQTLLKWAPDLVGDIKKY